MTDGRSHIARYCDRPMLCHASRMALSAAFPGRPDVAIHGTALYIATRGLQILAIDPGSEMIRVARETLANFANVELIEATFEAWPASEAKFQLIVAAESWHWVAPDEIAKAIDGQGGELDVDYEAHLYMPTWPVVHDPKRASRPFPPPDPCHLRPANLNRVSCD